MYSIEAHRWENMFISLIEIQMEVIEMERGWKVGSCTPKQLICLLQQC